MMKFGLVVVILAFCTASYAGTGSGKVLQILVISSGGNGSGVVTFRTETNANKAPCSTLSTDWAFSLEKEHGRAMYSLLLSAQAQQKTIGVAGANDCAAWGDRERPSYIHLDS